MHPATLGSAVVSQHGAGPEQNRAWTLSPLARHPSSLPQYAHDAPLARGRAQHHGQRQGGAGRGEGSGRRCRGPSPRPGRVPCRFSAATATSPSSVLCALLVLSPQVLLRNRSPSWRLLERMRSRRRAHLHAALRALPLPGPLPARCLAWTCHPPGSLCAIRPGPGHGPGASTTTARRLGALR